jgi:hypothetical protein
MSYDFNIIKPEPKLKTPLWRRVMAYAGAAGFICAIPFVGIHLSDYAHEKSIDIRTDASTEVHKRLGDAYAHLGDGNKVDRAPLGGVIYVHNNYIKTETCSSFTSTVFWDKTSHVVHHYSMFTNWFQPGTYEADEVYVIPPYLKPGTYNITKKTVSKCSDREYYTVNFDIKVTFYKPGTDAPKFDLTGPAMPPVH